MKYRQAYLEALQNFAAKDPVLTAEAAGCLFNRESGVVELAYLGRTCYVTYPAGAVFVRDWPDPPTEEQIIILQYLSGASRLPLCSHWLSFLQLPGGPHHFAPFQREAILPLAAKFGRQPERLCLAAESLGGVPATFGHAGVIIPVFPRVPLAIVLWTGDEEFTSTANILFDASAEAHLPTASLYMMGIAVASRLLRYPGQPLRQLI